MNNVDVREERKLILIEEIVPSGHIANGKYCGPRTNQLTC